MITINKQNRKGLSNLFKDYKWNYLPDAILEGTTGKVRVDREKDPSFAVLELPKLELYIPGGDPNHPAARDFIANLPKYSALIFASDGWEALLKENHTGRFINVPRYAFTSEALDIEHLSNLASRTPDGYQARQVDLNLAGQLAAEKGEFAEDHLRNFDSPEDFIRRGFGFCLMDGPEIASVATTFVVCSKGVEIQINTRENHQRKGLATAVAAQLMCHSLQKGLDPNWDAANQNSAQLAQKLGYTPQGTYPLWFLTDA
jgi:hypothetical protein